MRRECSADAGCGHGRERELAAARACLLDEAAPLLTVTGPGGVGKTRLALAVAAEVAAEFRDGAIWIDLAPVTDPDLVPAAAAAALGLALAPDRLSEELGRQLRPRQALLVLDNCEHVTAAPRRPRNSTGTRRSASSPRGRGHEIRRSH